MNKNQLKDQLKENVNHPDTISGIHNWCDRWCERCSKTKHCSVFKTTSHLHSENPEDFFKTLSMMLEATIDMIKDYCEKTGVDFESLNEPDFKEEYKRDQYLICNDDGVALAKQYANLVKLWLDSIKNKNPVGLEVRLQDTVLSDCMEVVQWYQYLLQVKMQRALLAYKDESELQISPYDSLGSAKLLLVSIERNISAWGYILQKFPEDEDEILTILVCLQKLRKQTEQLFPEALTFIRPGLDE